MHEHPANVAVFLTDGQAKFTQPDGKSQEVPGKAGTTAWDAGGKHLPEGRSWCSTRTPFAAPATSEPLVTIDGRLITGDVIAAGEEAAEIGQPARDPL
jgi:hypothetical protein